MEMKTLKDSVMEFLRDEEGASGIEYALVAAMVAVALVFFVEPISSAVGNVFEDIQCALTEGCEP